MAWWTPPPTLSARFAYDAYHVSGGQFLDQVSSNHITYGAAGVEGDVTAYMKCIEGVASPAGWPFAAPVDLTVGDAYTIVALIRVDVLLSLLYTTANSGGYLGRVDGGWTWSTRGTATINQVSVILANEWAFVAFTRTHATNTNKLYFNGIERYTGASSTGMPSTLTHIGHASTANEAMGKGDMLAGLAIYTGAASPAELKALEIEARRELKGPAFPVLVLDILPIAPASGCFADIISQIVTRPEGNQGAEVSGVVTEDGVPVRRVVRLHDTGSGYLVAETVSGADGSYVFKNLPRLNEYYVISFDTNGVANMVGKDRVKT